MDVFCFQSLLQQDFRYRPLHLSLSSEYRFDRYDYNFGHLAKNLIYTLIERKSKRSSFKASKGEAVVAYRKSLATQKMGRYRLSALFSG
jgi:hypothetical protein